MAPISTTPARRVALTQPVFRVVSSRSVRTGRAGSVAFSVSFRMRLVSGARASMSVAKQEA